MTLYEMLTVVAIISILSFFAYFSSTHVIVNTKVAKVKEEQTVISRALENYHVDYNQFPTEMQGLFALNGPMVYLSSIPADPFKDQKYQYYEFKTLGIEYIIVSAGPDSDIDFNDNFRNTPAYNELVQMSGSSNSSPQANYMKDQIIDYLKRRSYDPTNGTISNGDIFYYRSR